MTFFTFNYSSPSSQKISGCCKAWFAVAALVFLSACASSFRARQGDFSLPIETINLGPGTVKSARAHWSSDYLYVGGSAKPHQLTRPAHVDIQLIAAGGRMIAERTDRLDTSAHPRSAKGRHGSYSYVARFPLSEARQAFKIRVVYHDDLNCKRSS